MASSPHPTKLKTSRQREMECAVCLNRLCQPKMLFCSHNFCKNCLQRLVQNRKIVCPVCKKETAVGPGGVDDLPKNTTLINIMETFCESCLSKDREVCCDHCGLWFCAQCHGNCKQQQILTDKGNDLLNELIERKEQITDKMTSLNMTVESVKNQIDTRMRDMINTIQLSAERLKDEIDQEQKRQTDVLGKCSKTVDDLEKTISKIIDENNLRDEDFSEKHIEDITGQWRDTLITCSSDISKANKLIHCIIGETTLSVGELTISSNYENATFENFTFGSKGTAPGQFDKPSSVIISPITKNLIVLDANNDRLQVFNKHHEFILEFGSKGDQPGQFNFGGYASSLAVTDNGLIVVADTCNHRVQLLAEDGQHVRSIGSKGLDSGQFQYPIGLHVHDNLIYVCDAVNKRMQVFDVEGNCVRQFGSSDMFGAAIPMDVTVLQNKDVVVAAGNDKHPEEGKLILFGIGGQYKATIRNFTSGSNSAKLQVPYAVTTDNAGHIMVSDFHTHKIYILTATWRLLRTLGSGEHGTAQLNGPIGLVCSQEGNIIVADFFNQCVKILSVKI